jgi:hypothetical protein
MESVELAQAISLLSANIAELSELVKATDLDPVIRAKTLGRLCEQMSRLEILRNSPSF